MNKYFCRKDNDVSQTHLPYAGELVLANSPQEAAQTYAAAFGVPAGRKILVTPEGTWFDTGAVAPSTTFPSYS